MSYQVIQESWKDGLLESQKIHDFQNREDAGKYILSEKSEIDLSLYEVSEDYDDKDRSQGLELFYCSNEANGCEWAYYYYLKEIPDQILWAAIHYQSATTSATLPTNYRIRHCRYWTAA
jgi:hypothetical protein